MMEMSSRQQLYPTITNSINDDSDSESKTCGKILVVLSWILVCLTMPFSLFVCFKLIEPNANMNMAVETKLQS
ncbi:hypothetical protein PYW08_000499 [Mythimna loreyi]|uniref:Uncharacterized protein n=1 Tax=Mythimna loreyi TaxID=667449 RepID=A0ACC2RCL4_9NEOP|nr:hypothetical protein PYW08_000499 [Mythimna loreyi]